MEISVCVCEREGGREGTSMSDIEERGARASVREMERAEREREREREREKMKEKE